ncbi:phage scaffolding protein [Cellulosilyticum sp. I15G10I2]|uniref:phage scaffolding protein n=1 Tax=Cellulosilyticum sp. I15G10I2 TaxID=1892843 RepID=UPI00085BBB63|nr:phage scaffolding protein [Cellulosilyticum sp. I15G10I2]
MKKLLVDLGIDQEIIKKIITGMKRAKVYTTSLERADERYTKLKKQYELLKKQLELANSEIDRWQKLNDYNEILKAEIDAYRMKIDTIKIDYDSQLCSLIFDNALSKKLEDFDAKYHQLLINAFNKDKLVLEEDGSIKGLDEQYEAIKAKYAEFIITS